MHRCQQRRRCWNDGRNNSLKIGGTHGHVEEFIDGDLLTLWRYTSCDWRPIRNCTGRYTCREKKRKPRSTTDDADDPNSTVDDGVDTGRSLFPSEMDPLELMEHAAVAFGGTAEVVGGIRHPWEIQKFHPAPGRSDPIWVLPLDPGHETGIITYVKDEETKTDERTAKTVTSRRYVHTLNARSGFQRKLHAVGIKLSLED